MIYSITPHLCLLEFSVVTYWNLITSISSPSLYPNRCYSQDYLVSQPAFDVVLLYLLLTWADFTHSSGVSFVYLEKVNVDWVDGSMGHSKIFKFFSFCKMFRCRTLLFLILYLYLI